MKGATVDEEAATAHNVSTVGRRQEPCGKLGQRAGSKRAPKRKAMNNDGTDLGVGKKPNSETAR